MGKTNKELFNDIQTEEKDQQDVFLNSLNKLETDERIERIKNYFYMNEFDDIELDTILLEIKKKTKIGLKTLRRCYQKKRKEKSIDEGNYEGDEAENNDAYKSVYIDEEKKMIAEQVYNGVKCQFCVYDAENSNAIYKDYIFDGTKNIYPLVGEEIEKRAILLPSKVEEYVDEEMLDTEIKNFINTWLDIPEDFLQFALWNIKRSWVFEKFHTLNYLRALGDTGQGKTRFLDALGAIHYKAIETSGATTAAPVFRIIEKWRGTLIMDEADFSKSDEAQDIIKIINMGYEKGKHVMRCDQNDAKKIDFFDPYCPKILATRKTFTDKAVESRCITLVMKGTNRKDIPFNLNKNFYDSALKIRNKLLLWRFRKYFTINPEADTNFDMGDLEPRVKQIVNSFVNLFGDDAKQLEKFKVFINGHQEDLIDERKNSFAGSIVGAIYELIQDNELNISPANIINRGKLTNFKGEPLQPRGLSSTLKALGFGKLIMRRIGENTKRCLNLEKDLLINLFKRYGYGVTVDMGNGTDKKKEEVSDTIENTPFSFFVGTPVEPKHRNNRNNNTPLRRQENVTVENPTETTVTTVTDQEVIHYNCTSCGSTPCFKFDKTGKPLCKECFDAKEAQ